MMLYSFVGCKGTNKRVKNQIIFEFFEREYFRALLKGTNKRVKNQIISRKMIICG